MIDRRLRLASSSPDVKALFNNSPSYIYHLEEEDDYEQSNYMPGSSANDYWPPMPPIVSVMDTITSWPVVDGTLDTQGSNVPHRTHHTAEDALKRGSDSLLEAKLKDQLSKPRSLTNRAQSLDLTFSLSRISEAPRGSGLSRPESPDTSVTGTGTNGTSSPTSATAPLFPSVYGPPVGSRGVVGGPSSSGLGHARARSSLGIDEDPVDDVSRVISNLGL